MKTLSVLHGGILAVANRIRPSFTLGFQSRVQDFLFFHQEENDEELQNQIFQLSLRRDDMVDRLNQDINNTRGHLGLTAPNQARLRRRSMLLPVKRYFSSAPKEDEKSQRKPLLGLRQGISAFLSVGGFLVSSMESVLANYKSKSLQAPMKSIKLFMKNSGLDKEVAQTVSPYMALDVRLLGAIQEELWKTRYVAKEIDRPPLVRRPLFWTEAKRYMRYATAAYGPAMIHAADVEVRGNFEHMGKVTEDAVADHIGLQPSDIKLFDVDYDGDSKHLRHFVAVDHDNQKVVLSMRGTFSPQEVIVDACAFSSEFCGGEAHSEMAAMSERVWEQVGPTILQLLNENPGYEFIITGHSLGAGTACLLTILIQSNNLVAAPTRCFAYAAPPVFTPLEVIPDVDAITNFIHNTDVIPFMSVYSVRNLFSQMRRIQAFAHTQMSHRSRFRIFMGWKPATPEMVQHHKEWKPYDTTIEGAPQLQVPAAGTIWMQEKTEGSYDWEHYTPEEMKEHYSQIRIHPDMWTDHFPASYEFGFDHIWLEDLMEDEEASVSC